MPATVVRSSPIVEAFSEYGKAKKVGAWIHVEADKPLPFTVTTSDVKNGRPGQPDICPAANGILRSSDLGVFVDGVEVGKNRVLLLSWLEKVVVKFFVNARLRQNITVFDRFHNWLELGTFTLDPLPPSLRRGYKSPGLIEYPHGIRRPRGRRLVFRVDELTR